jgi:hypothetical protein
LIHRIDRCLLQYNLPDAIKYGREFFNAIY